MQKRGRAYSSSVRDAETMTEASDSEMESLPSCSGNAAELDPILLGLLQKNISRTKRGVYLRPYLPQKENALKQRFFVRG